MRRILSRGDMSKESIYIEREKRDGNMEKKEWKKKKRVHREKECREEKERVCEGCGGLFHPPAAYSSFHPHSVFFYILIN